MKKTTRILALGLLTLPAFAYAQESVSYDVPTPLAPDYSGNQVDRVTGSPTEIEEAVAARLKATWRNRMDVFQNYDFKIRQDYDNIALRFEEGRVIVTGVAANERARDNLLSDLRAVTTYEVDSRLRLRS
ncbi:MAG: hypothetical protein Q7P63_11150 [Verrucomicrobiota bacterium JB022]|nr:hypothetical protein [Verrucomicrobiota bacterium JB022]